MALRLAFMGTPDFAVPTLVELVGGGHEVVAVYSRAPQPAGRRGLELTPSPVAREAEKLKLPVFTPSSLKGDEAAAAMRAHGADAAIVVAYGLILPKPILESCPLGCFNLHASLLPRWRGAAPIHRALMAGDHETGVSVMKMEEGLDTGPVACEQRLPIKPDATTGDVHDELARLGAKLMLVALGALERDTLQVTPQRRKRHLRQKDRQKRKRALTGTSRGRRCTTIAADCRVLSRRLVRVCRCSAASKCCERRKARAEGLPGSVLDDKLTIACGDGSVRLISV